VFGYTMKITYSNLVIFILFYFLTLVIENLKNHFFFSEFWISLFNHELSKEIKMFTALSNQALTKCKSFASFEWNSDSSQSDVCFLNFHGNVFSEFLTFHNIDWLHIFNVVATLKCKVHVHATRNKSSTLVKHQSITCVLNTLTLHMWVGEVGLKTIVDDGWYLSAKMWKTCEDLNSRKIVDEL
jgi:hypothetical protein